jgi:dihydropyrimidine dehydrogenase (NAD+) subunit PreT
MVLKAVGQHFILPEAEGFPALRDGRIVVDAARQTSIPGVFAGGDATSGVDLTVRAVEDGKRAAEAIDRYLGKMRERAHG